MLFMIRTTAYTKATGLSLLQGWQAPVLDHTPTWRLTNYFRRSEDNGRTWSISTPDLPDEPTAEGLLRRDNVLLFLDPGSGLLIRAYHLMHAKERGEQIENCRNFYQISRDGGISWEDERQIIQEGREYDESHWARDVDMGRNAGMIAGILKVEKLADGTLLLPIQMGNNRDFHLRQAVFRGRWREDLSDIDWDVGELRVGSPGAVEGGGLRWIGIRTARRARAASAASRRRWERPPSRHGAVSRDLARRGLDLG